MANGPTPRLLSRNLSGLSAPSQTLTSTGAIVTGTAGIIDSSVLIPVMPDIVRNLFEASRPGTPVLRPDDLLALRIELVNLVVSPGDPPTLSAGPSGTARLILHFPPQTITEETFFEVPQQDIEPPEPGDPGAHPHPDAQDKPEPPGSGSEALRKPPVRARIADESRLAFKFPADLTIDYTLQGILAACQDLEPAVGLNARKPSVRGRIITVSDLFNTRAVNALAPKNRAALASHAVGSLRIGAVADDITTLRTRQGAGGAVFRPVPELTIPDLGGITLRQPRPANPSARLTAIEMPWRLILSPHSGSRWRHAPQPVSAPGTQRTELWHTRMVTPQKDGSEIMPPYPDPNRTVRAVWAKSGSGVEAANPPMQSDWPASNNLPAPGITPFRMPLDNFDRFQIAHLSSNFSVSGYVPRPVSTNTLMLSALGGWLDSHAAWEPPGLSVEAWLHRATMGRDHYVKVVYRGFLCPLPFPCTLVKISERKFHNGNATAEQEPGNVAYLRQRYFMVFRNRELTFDEQAFRNASTSSGTVTCANQFPFSRLEILTETTPDLDDPANFDVDGKGQLMFWPHVGGTPFRFQIAATDLDGRRSAFDLPMIFMDNTVACPRFPDGSPVELKPDFTEAEANARTAADAFAAAATSRKTTDFDQQRVALAPPVKSGDTSVEAVNVTFGAEYEEGNASLRTYSNDLSRPVFLPKIVSVEAKVGAMSHLTGSTKTNSLSWNPHFLQFGFNATAASSPGPNENRGEIFVDVNPTLDMAQLDFSAQGDKSGGFIQPNLRPKALSRFAGPVMSDVEDFISGTMPAGAGFPTAPGDLPLPLLFGCIKLSDVIELVGDITGSPEQVPKFVSEAGTKIESFINVLVRIFNLAHDLANDPIGVVDGLLVAFRSTLDDLIAQAQAYAASLVDPILAKIAELETALDDLVSRLQ
ncbi:MAG: hypothetical protein AAGA05_00815, partial [Pseudomonadota bacterium]